MIRPPRERGDEINLAVMTLSHAAATIHISAHSIWNLLLIISIYHLSSHLVISLGFFFIITPNRKLPQKQLRPKQPAPRNIRNRQKKFDGNINKRGHVPIGKAAEHTDDPPISKGLIAFFMFVVIGSSIVQILRMFQTSVPNLTE